jgi:hypothetical protein
MGDVFAMVLAQIKCEFEIDRMNFFAFFFFFFCPKSRLKPQAMVLSMSAEIYIWSPVRRSSAYSSRDAQHPSLILERSQTVIR